jgi:hypothetical protein
MKAISPVERAPVGWPKNATVLSGRIRRLAPALRLTGIDVEVPSADNRASDKSRARLFRLRRVQRCEPDSSVRSVQSVQYQHHAVSGKLVGSPESDATDAADDGFALESRAPDEARISGAQLVEQTAEVKAWNAAAHKRAESR